MTTPRQLLPALGLLLIGCGAGGLYAQFDRNLTGFIVAALLQGALWAGAAAIVLRRGTARPTLALVLVVAGVLRVGALAAPVYLSDDIYRYIWDGRVQAAGINPYRYIPTAPALAALRDQAVFPEINRNNYAPTIYPPVAQMLFLLASRFGGSVLAMKLWFVALEAVGIAALLFVLRAAAVPSERILLYAWHPLPVWEIAGAGHVDAAVVAFVALGLAAAVGGRRGWSGAALAAATLVKFFPVVLAPALWRPGWRRGWRFSDWRWPAAFAAFVLAAYLPYIGVGSRVLGFLPGYVVEENLASGSGFWALDMARRAFPVPLAAYLAVAAVVMAGLAAGALRRPGDPLAGLPWATALGTAALFFASPHYPWYFVWLVAVLALAPWWPAWWPTLTAVFLYWHPKTGHIPLWVGLVVYGGFVVLSLVDFARRLLSAARSGGQDGGRRTG